MVPIWPGHNWLFQGEDSRLLGSAWKRRKPHRAASASRFISRSEAFIRGNTRELFLSRGLGVPTGSANCNGSPATKRRPSILQIGIGGQGSVEHKIGNVWGRKCKPEELSELDSSTLQPYSSRYLFSKSPFCFYTSGKNIVTEAW